MLEGICKKYMLNATKQGNIFPEESCIPILSKILEVFVNQVNELKILIEKKHFVEALGKAKDLCIFEKRLSDELSFINPFYNVGRLEFKQSIESLIVLKEENKNSLKEQIEHIRLSKVTVFSLVLADFLKE